jgi:hypothetical protein
VLAQRLDGQRPPTVPAPRTIDQHIDARFADARSTVRGCVTL